MLLITENFDNATKHCGKENVLWPGSFLPNSIPTRVKWTGWSGSLIVWILWVNVLSAKYSGQNLTQIWTLKAKVKMASARVSKFEIWSRATTTTQSVVSHFCERFYFEEDKSLKAKIMLDWNNSVLLTMLFLSGCMDIALIFFKKISIISRSL